MTHEPNPPPSRQDSCGRCRWLCRWLCLCLCLCLCLGIGIGIGIGIAALGFSSLAAAADTIKVGVLHCNQSLVMVEHDMKFIGELTQNGRNGKKVTVLHEGSVLAEGLLSEVQANERVVEVHLGQ